MNLLHALRESTTKTLLWLDNPMERRSVLEHGTSMATDREEFSTEENDSFLSLFKFLLPLLL